MHFYISFIQYDFTIHQILKLSHEKRMNRPIHYIYLLFATRRIKDEGGKGRGEGGEKESAISNEKDEK